MAVVYTVLPAAEVTDATLEECSRLFSEHYGVWGPNPLGLKVGARVRMSPSRLKATCLFGDTACTLVTARVGGTLVGHAFATKFWYEAGGGYVSWITQLIVSSTYRSRGIGASLCRHAWDAAAEFACGLVSSHPHAVRALEKAAQRLCDPVFAAQHASGVIRASSIPYVKDCAFCQDEPGGSCTIDTSFYVDHTAVNQLTAQQLGWQLGALPDGHEYFAFTAASSAPKGASSARAAGP